MAPFWEQSPPIFRPLRSQNGAPAPRRLCACSSRCTPAAAQRTTWMPWQWRHCAQNLIRSGFGGIEKLRFPPPPGPCEQPGAQSSCRTSSSISWLPKDRQSSTRAVSRAYELLLRLLCTKCAICYELRIHAEYISNKSTCGGVVFFCALSEQMSSGGNIIQRPPALRAVHQD